MGEGEKTEETIGAIGLDREAGWSGGKKNGATEGRFVGEGLRGKSGGGASVEAEQTANKPTPPGYLPSSETQLGRSIYSRGTC